MKSISIFIFLLSFSILNAQNRYYVNASATGTNNGLSWENAYTTLQPALLTSQSGVEVWVAEGTYYPTSTTNRNLSFEPASGSKLYGGFVGTEISLNQRDWVAHPTVLSGDIGISGDSTDNSYNVLYLFEPDTSTLLDGFVVRDGTANDPQGNTFEQGKCGGGLNIQSIDMDAFGIVRNCIFKHNSAQSFGGAVMINGFGSGSSAPRFINCRFEDNRVVGSGGGLARFGSSWEEAGIDFEGCRFVQNQAGLRGGGLYYSDSEGNDKVEIKNCQFLKNMAIKAGGGAYLVTGRSNGSEWAITGTEFRENKSDEGGALRFLPAGISIAKELVIDSCSFVDNLFVASAGSPHPAAVVLIDQIGETYSRFLFAKSNFSNNKNWVNGFTMAWNDVEFVLSANQFYNNHLVGVAFLTDASSVVIDKMNFRENSLGEIFFDFPISIKTEIKNSLVANNYGRDFFYRDNAQNDSFNITNCIFSNNTILVPTSINSIKTKFLIVSNTALIGIKDIRSFLFAKQHGEISYSFIDSINCQGFTPFNITCGLGNLIGLNPQFRDTAAGDYSLLPCSPLINSGSNAAAAGIQTDLAGNPRIQEGTVDIGAYEAPAFALAAEPEVHFACVGTSNGSISISPAFGCEPYSYNWLPMVGNGPQLNGLPPGSYLLTITDGSGRQILDTLQVGSAPLPVLNPVATNVQCGTTLGGSITAGLSSGTAPFHYQWLPGAADTAYLSHLSPGDYGLTVVDANGCQDSASASIALMGMITLMVDGQAISCYGQTDGWLSATPATGAAPFSWLWQGWAGVDSIAQPLGPGSYAVTVSDAFGCTASFAFPTMTQPGLLSATVGISDQTDLNMPNGAAVVTTISGGTSPFGYEWSTGSTMQAIAGLTAGKYTVTVTDEHGCETVHEVIVQLMVGTSEAEGEVLLMYPNPAADWLKIVLPARHGLSGGPAGQDLSGGHAGQDLSGGPSNANERRIELADASGRVVLKTRITAGDNISQMDLSGLPTGSYLVTVYEGSGGVFVGGVVKR